jgi:hypothetical protein
MATPHRPPARLPSRYSQPISRAGQSRPRDVLLTIASSLPPEAYGFVLPLHDDMRLISVPTSRHSNRSVEISDTLLGGAFLSYLGDLSFILVIIARRTRVPGGVGRDDECAHNRADDGASQFRPCSRCRRWLEGFLPTWVTVSVPAAVLHSEPGSRREPGNCCERETDVARSERPGR